MLLKDLAHQIIFQINMQVLDVTLVQMAMNVQMQEVFDLGHALKAIIEIIWKVVFVVCAQ